MGQHIDEAKGRMEQAIGDLTDNKELTKKGKADRRAAAAKGVVADAKHKADDMVDRVSDSLSER